MYIISTRTKRWYLKAALSLRWTRSRYTPPMGRGSDISRHWVACGADVTERWAEAQLQARFLTIHLPQRLDAQSESLISGNSVRKRSWNKYEVTTEGGFISKAAKCFLIWVSYVSFFRCRVRLSFFEKLNCFNYEFNIARFREGMIQKSWPEHF